MSEEFLKIATDEINEEIAQIQNIVSSSPTRIELCKNASQIQKSTHKIKGLAPMMGKEELGSLSALLDSIFKKISNTSITDEMFDSLVSAVGEMKNSMIHSDYNLDEIKQKISQISSAVS
jgi:chemotaxis protein histidine kinase CheA